jgi:ubiquinone/menaquinone biosynthesis C-methylase UbiE
MSIYTRTTMDTTTRYINALYVSDKHNLLKLFKLVKWYGINTKNLYRKLAQWVFQKKSDTCIVKLIVDMMKCQNTRGVFCDNIERSMKRAKDITTMLYNKKDYINTNVGNDTVYLDVGAGNGIITKAVSDVLNIAPCRTYATDIDRWSGKNNKAVNIDIIYQYVNKYKFKTTYKSNMFDLVTMFQTMHHVEDLQSMLSEIYRITKPNGLIIIREHNASNCDVEMLCHLEHLFYGVLEDNLSIDNFLSDYYGCYRSADNFDDLFARKGFRCSTKWFKQNPTKCYYAVYIKNSRK